MTDGPGICVVGQPIGETGDSAPRTLLDILSAVTCVSLVAAAVPDDAAIREDYEIVDAGDNRLGGSVVREALGFLRAQMQMCRIITRRDEEVVLFFGTTSYLLPILWARLIGRTVVLEPRGDVPLRLRIHWEQRFPAPVPRLFAGAVSLLERAGYRTANAIIAYSPSMARDLGLKRYDHKLHSNGARYVDVDRFKIQTPFADRDPVIGYVGRFEAGKGVRALAGAVPHLPDDVVVRFIGDGPLADELAEELHEEIAADRVELTGWVDHDDIPTELNDLRLLVLPSESEGLPTILIESLACGTPGYATPVSGVPDVVHEGETGFLIEDITPKAIARDVDRILHDEPLAEISDNGRRLVEDEYSLNAAIDRYRAILSSVTGRPLATETTNRESGS